MSALIRILYAAVSALLMSVLAHADGRPDVATRTSVCHLAQTGKKMDGHIVRLQAIFISDLMHTSLLKDQRCPTESISPFVEEENRDPSLEKFDTALLGTLEDRELRVFRVDLSGVYRWNEGDAPHGRVIIKKIWKFERKHGDWRIVK